MIPAIREDRTRGGRSTYQCTYTVPQSLAGGAPGADLLHQPHVKMEPSEGSGSPDDRPATPPLLKVNGARRIGGQGGMAEKEGAMQSRR